MFRKKMPHGTKIFVIPGIALSFIAGAALFFTTHTSGLESAMGRVGHADAAGSLLSARETAHLHWAETLRQYVYQNTATIPAVQDDPGQCILGAWLHSSDRQLPRGIEPELAGILTEMEEAHFRLHASATVIRQLKERGDAEKAASVFERETLPGMHAVRQALDAMSDVIERHKADNFAHASAHMPRVSGSAYAIAAAGALLALALGLAAARAPATPVAVAGCRPAKKPCAGTADEIETVAADTAQLLAEADRSLAEIARTTRQIVDLMASLPAAH